MQSCALAQAGRSNPLQQKERVSTVMPVSMLLMACHIVSLMDQALASQFT